LSDKQDVSAYESEVLESLADSGLTEITEAELERFLQYLALFESIQKNTPEQYSNIRRASKKAADQAEQAADADYMNVYMDTFEKEFACLEAKRLSKHSMINSAPTVYKEPGDKLNNLIFGLFTDDNKHILPMANKDNSESKTCETSYKIDLKRNDKKIVEVTLRPSDSEFDIDELLMRGFGLYEMRVFGAIKSWLDRGQYIMSYDMIWRVMTGKQSGSGIGAPKKQRELIDQALTKFLYTEISYKEMLKPDSDSKENKSFKGARKYRGPIIHGDRADETLNGQYTENVLRVLEYPKLMQYGEPFNQIRAYPIKLLQIPGSQDETAIRLTEYLTFKINGMRSGGLKTRHITKKELYEISEVFNDESRDSKYSKQVNYRKRKSIDKKVESYLDYWKTFTMPDGSPFIQDWKIHESAKGNLSYEIILPKKKSAKKIDTENEK